MSDFKLVKRTPQITKTLKICPIPFKYDTYVGCNFGCKYCFARDIVQFARGTHNKSNMELNKFSYMIACDPNYLDMWIKKTMNSNIESAERVALKERIPIKIGVTSDPFPYIEKTKKITYETLKILNKYDYPVQISTKNPELLADYCEEFFINNTIPNWAISVTMITCNEETRKAIEPNAPSIQSRLNGIKRLSDKGFKVMIRIQPVIYPYISSIQHELIHLLRQNGAYGIILEGLKIKKAMNKDEMKIYQEIGEYLGYDLRQWYKTNGEQIGSDYVISKKDKLVYICNIQELCIKYGLICYIGDNDCKEFNPDCECCGTKFLRNHKTINESEKLMDCRIRTNRSNVKKEIRSILYGIE